MLRIAIPALMLFAATASAEAHYACAVKRTADGFVALREGPSAKHKIVAPMKAQELVDIMHLETEDIKQSGDWVGGAGIPGHAAPPSTSLRVTSTPHVKVGCIVV